MRILFRVLDDLGLPQDVDLDLTGVLHFLLDLLGQVPGQDDHLVLADLLGPHHDPHLAAGLDGVGLIHAGIGAGDGLQLLQTLDVVFVVFASCGGTCGAYCVGCLYKSGNNRVYLNIAVVSNLVPNTGISLPFFSAGGTSLIMLMFEMGIVLSVSRRAKL